MKLLWGGVAETTLPHNFTSLPGSAHAERHPMALPIVRISRGRFDAHRYEDIRKRLADARLTLIPAIQALPGMLHYYVGIDAETSTMVNISIWNCLEHAQQMSTLGPMLALVSGSAPDSST